MGYKTDYTLEVSAPHEDIPESLVQALVSNHFFEDRRDSEFFKNDTWYEWNEDMLKLSKLYPDVLFELSGEGEESSDIWTYWYRNGQLQGGLAQIVHPEFSEDKWETPS